MLRVFRLLAIPKIIPLKFITNAMSNEKLCHDAAKIFEAAVKSVQPWNLIHNTIKTSPISFNISDNVFPVDHNVYVVGFGKAVYGMASALENIVGEHIVSGIISVPSGIQKQIKSQKLVQLSSKIKVYEGAANNLPDENSLLASSEIKKIVSSLPESSLLLVLISGGGSALLPAPKPPLSLKDKQQITSLLAAKGATIEEINTIRKKLSTLKGGGLALLAKPAKVVSLILSDIVGDPLNFIASGPTVKNQDDPHLPITIIQRYGLQEQMSPATLNILEQIPNEEILDNFDRVCNIIVGNNTVALNAAAQNAESLGYKTLIITSALTGNADDVGKKLITMMKYLLKKEISALSKIYNELNLPIETLDNLVEMVNQFYISNKKFCLAIGGETTVEIKGAGVGGRNQELALAASIELYKSQWENPIVLLSAGTDGIDGPTSAAGAMATPSVLQAAKNGGIDAAQYLLENNSYNFYSSVGEGKWHMKTGHTGTNVMDIILILVDKAEIYPS